jgi:hypothetical protein
MTEWPPSSNEPGWPDDDLGPGGPDRGYDQPPGSSYRPAYGRPPGYSYRPGSEHGQGQPPGYGHGPEYGRPAGPGYGPGPTRAAGPGYSQPSGYGPPPGSGPRPGPGYGQQGRLGPPSHRSRTRPGRASGMRLAALIGIPALALIAAIVIAMVLVSGGHPVSTNPASYPEAGKSASKILSDMHAAGAKATSAVVVGRVTESGQSIGLDLHLVGKTGGYGTISSTGGQLRIVVIGRTVYMKAPASVYEKKGASKAIGQLLGGKWIKGALNSPGFSDFGKFMSLKAMVSSKPGGTVTKLPGITIINGTPTVALRDNSDGSRLYVAVTGATLPVRLIGGRHETGSVSITGYGKPVKLTAPTGAVDLTQLEHGG